MLDVTFNNYATIGIGLTFAASISATIVSIFSIKETKRLAQKSDYLSIITASRERVKNTICENASLYFNQINRICRGQEHNLTEIYNELTRYHFAIILFAPEPREELHNEMSAIRNKALEIVRKNNIIIQRYKEENIPIEQICEPIENEVAIRETRREIGILRNSILENHQDIVFNKIIAMIESEKKAQHYEVTAWREQKRPRKTPPTRQADRSDSQKSGGEVGTVLPHGEQTSQGGGEVGEGCCGIGE